MNESPIRSTAELREWEAGLDPGGLAGFVARTSRTAQRLAAREKLVFETLQEEKDRKHAEWIEANQDWLDSSQVREVRKLREQGESLQTIAQKMDRDPWSIQRLLNGKSYKGVK